MGNPNNFIGPNGGIPVFDGGSSYENLTANGSFQVKSARGSFTGISVNTAGTTSSIALYDGLSSPVTITIAAPGVITWPNHGLPAGSSVQFETTGALPTGLTAGTTYYVANDSNLTTSTFAVSDTKAHALAGTNQVATSGSQSGTQTGFNVSNKMASYSTTVQNAFPTGMAFLQGLLAILAGGAAADVTVLYV